MTEEEEHPLQSEWRFYYFERPEKSEDWEKSIHEIGAFSSCEKFWAFYSHMVRPDNLKEGLALHLFKDNYKAMWEDENIKYGGYITIRLNKRQIQYLWEKLILNMIGEQISDFVIGAVVSPKARSDSIEIWLDFRNDFDDDKERIKLDVIKVLIEKLAISGKMRFEFTDFQQFKTESQNQSKQIEYYLFDGDVVKRVDHIGHNKRQ